MYPFFKIWSKIICDKIAWPENLRKFKIIEYDQKYNDKNYEIDLIWIGDDIRLSECQFEVFQSIAKKYGLRIKKRGKATLLAHGTCLTLS